MKGRRFACVIVLPLGLTLLATVLAAPQPKVATAAKADSAEALSARIDKYFAKYWQTNGIQPAPLADDAEFIRRVCLDVIGRIPNHPFEIGDFLDDPAPEKRRMWIDKLLATDSYADHLTSVWRELLLPDAGTDENPMLRQSFEEWLHFRLRENASYDRMVSELLGLRSMADNAQIAAFYQANERKPENVAATTARLFLGMRLECAQCHNHPTAKWTKQDFWGYTAFFADIQSRKPDEPKLPDLKIPGSDEVPKPRFPNAADALANPGDRPRQTLAKWLTAPDNPYFARATVNMLWGYFLGHGLVEPADEAGEDHPSDHNELLNEIAHQWALNKFDIKYLIRGILGSRPYQLTSAATHGSQDDPQRFARMAVRSLTAEQLFDSVAEVCAYKSPEDRRSSPFERMNGPTPRAQFRDRFAGKGNRTESETTILQALFLMNGNFISDASSLEKNIALGTVAAANTTTARRIETIYLVTLSRKPRTEELARLVRYVDGSDSEANQKKALTDVQWALLNSAEFRVNH